MVLETDTGYLQHRYWTLLHSFIKHYLQKKKNVMFWFEQKFKKVPNDILEFCQNFKYKYLYFYYLLQDYPLNY